MPLNYSGSFWSPGKCSIGLILMQNPEMMNDKRDKLVMRSSLKQNKVNFTYYCLFCTYRSSREPIGKKNMLMLRQSARLLCDSARI